MVDVVDLYSICLFIQDHLEGDLSLMFLAKTAGLSRFRFHRVFKSWRGETLHDFVTRLRMERAAFELGYPMARSSRRSIKAIAFASGYKSLSSFSHAFSAFARVSPRQFRYRVLQHRGVLPQRDRIAALAGARLPVSEAMHAFHPLAVTVADQPQRHLAILESTVPGYRPVPCASGQADIAFYGVAFLPELFARARRSHGLVVRGAPLSCVGIEELAWHRLAPCLAPGANDDCRKRASLTLAAGRYAVIEGQTSLASLYRLWRRGFDAWLSATGECPRSERAFVRWTGRAPRNIYEVAQLALHVPLVTLPDAGHAERNSRTGASSTRPAGN